MATDNTDVDLVIKQLGGCGLFQVLFTTVVTMPSLSGAFSLIFMAFGAYNPGWSCLDNLTVVSSLDLDGRDNASRRPATNVSTGVQAPGQEARDSCVDYDRCQNIEFSPEASTIVTEWGLLCGSSWAVPVILTVQMAGFVLGGLSAGFLGDMFGRKFTVCLNVLIHAVFNFVSIYSSSWEIFSVFRFIMAFSSIHMVNIGIVYITENVPRKWHPVGTSLPNWCLGCVMFSICALVFKDWRQMHIFNAVFSLVFFLPVVFMPESLRWLLVKGKKKQYAKAVSMIGKINRVSVAKDVAECPSFSLNKQRETTSGGYTFLALFRKSTRLYTFVLSFTIFSSNVAYFGSTYGVSSLPGDVYTNSIIMFATELPAHFICWSAPNLVGRKPSLLVSTAVQTLCLFLVVIFDFFTSGAVKEMGMLILMVIARIMMDTCFYLVFLYTNELYPTVIRSTASGAMMFSGGVGGLVGSYLVPPDPSVLYVSYLVMASLTLVCLFLACLLPETRGKDLFDHVESQDQSENENFEPLHSNTRHLEAVAARERESDAVKTLD